jgi:alkanesulfonate monooxygenase SsuD/methylene tetrahydromethanopterin reductase-like flavin-dependent oxidoreductase (luciferase family)
MKFGIMVNHQFLRSEDVGRRLDDIVVLAETARDLGFESLFSHHHYLANLQTPQALPVLARLVPSTGDMRLGIGVYLATYEHPVQLAENFATLDQLSGGRLILGVGAGYRDDEFTTFGVDGKRRWTRLAETLELVDKLWTGERVTHRGEFFTVEDQAISVVPRQRPRPAFWMGANAERTIRRSGAIGDAWLAPPNVKARWAKGHLLYFKEALAARGIAPEGREHPIVRELYVTDRDDAVDAEIGEYVRNEYLAFAQYDSVYERYFADMWQKSFLFGSPDTVAQKIADLADGGFTTFIFRTNWPGMPIERSLESLRRFAAEVMPRFAPATIA